MNRLLYINDLYTFFSGDDVFTLAFLGIAVLLALVWKNFLLVFIHKIRELILSKDWRSFEAENANSGPRLRLHLSVISLASVSLFLFQMIRYSGLPSVPYLQVLLFLFVMHLARILLTKSVEFVFSMRGIYEMWIESYAWIHYIMGVLFFPLVVLLTYSPSETYTSVGHAAIVVFFLAEALLFYRLFAVFYNGIVSLFYLFLYLCTLEILPVLIVLRFIS